MKIILFFSAILLFIDARTQDIQKEIDEQVWKPFITTFENRDADGFLAVHSKDLTRSSRDDKSILNWDEYLQQQREGNKRGLTSGWSHAIELHFSERIADKDRAIDVGIYKTSSFNKKEGKNRVSYGRFHVVLRKESNVWKILVDMDSSEGGTIGEKDFAAAKPMGM